MPTVSSLSLYIPGTILKSFFLWRKVPPGRTTLLLLFWKRVLEYIVNPLIYVYQLSLPQGHYPSDLKIPKVIPLNKCKDRGLFNN